MTTTSKALRVQPARPATNRHARTRRVLAACAFAVLGMIDGTALAQDGEYRSHWSPTSPGLAYAFLGGLTRTGGSTTPYSDFTVAVQATARNDRNVDQWAFGVAAEAWAMPGSKSTLVSVEAAVVNEEPLNLQAKIAANMVFKNRPDGVAAPPSAMNQNSIAMWVTAQPGTGFERGLVFASGSLMHAKSRPVVLDVSDLSDDEIARVDLIRLRPGVALRYDPRTQQLVIAVETPGL